MNLIYVTQRYLIIKRDRSFWKINMDSIVYVVDVNSKEQLKKILFLKR